MNIRVGFGFDVHPLVKGRELWLGGIKLESEKGAEGHSDADVLLRQPGGELARSRDLELRRRRRGHVPECAYPHRHLKAQSNNPR